MAQHRLDAENYKRNATHLNEASHSILYEFYAYLKTIILYTSKLKILNIDGIKFAPLYAPKIIEHTMHVNFSPHKPYIVATFTHNMNLFSVRTMVKGILWRATDIAL